MFGDFFPIWIYFADIRKTLLRRPPHQFHPFDTFTITIEIAAFRALFRARKFLRLKPLNKGKFLWSSILVLLSGMYAQSWKFLLNSFWGEIKERQLDNKKDAQYSRNRRQFCFVEYFREFVEIRKNYVLRLQEEIKLIKNV